MVGKRDSRSRKTSLRLSFTIDDEGLALLGDFSFDLTSSVVSVESDGADSGFSTPESFSPLPETVYFDEAALHELTAVSGQDLLKPLQLLAAPTSLSDLPPMPMFDFNHFQLGDICEQIDVAGAADFIGLHVDSAHDFLADLALGTAAWDPSLLLQGTSSLLLSNPPTSLSLGSHTTTATAGMAPGAAVSATSQSIRPAMVDNAQGSTSEDEEDEIDVVTVEEETTTALAPTPATTAATLNTTLAARMVPSVSALAAVAKPEPVQQMPIVAAALEAQPLASTVSAMDVDIATVAAVAHTVSLPAVSAAPAAATTTTVPVATAAAAAAPAPASSAAASVPATVTGLPPLSSISMSPLMFASGSYKAGASTAAAAVATATTTTASPAASRSSTSLGNKYHPYASLASSAAAAAAANNAHTPKRNTERKRQLHNELERKRREDLNNVFNALGDVVPDLTGPGKNGQPTQTQILQGATDHLRYLKDNHAELCRQREAALSHQAALRARLMELTATA